MEIKGSLATVAKENKMRLANAFLNVKAVVAIDVSGSMESRDAGNGQSRFDAALTQLIKLQRDFPGQVAIVSFDDQSKFHANGLPTLRGGGTDMNAALELVKPFDGTSAKIILISDGEPYDETGTLQTARAFKSKIDTIFVGSETSPGRDFLRRLSALTGGLSVNNETQKLGELSQNISLLLQA